MNRQTLWKITVIVELVAAAMVVWFDLLLPTLVLLGMAAVSLLVRREHIRTLGFKRPRAWRSMVGVALFGAVCLQLFDAGVSMPILNRLTGATIDYSGFAQLQGNLGQLLLLLALSWTLAALGEEIVYRGYLQKRITDLFGSDQVGIGLAVVISSLLFGLAHTEQGFVGVAVTFVDALFFSWLKWRYDNNLWAPILAHGFYNSIGIIIFYFLGPIDGLW